MFLEESNLAVEPRIDNVGDDHESDVENAEEDCLNGSQLRRNNLCRQLSLCFFREHNHGCGASGNKRKGSTVVRPSDPFFQEIDREDSTYEDCQSRIGRKKNQRAEWHHQDMNDAAKDN